MSSIHEHFESFICNGACLALFDGSDFVAVTHAAECEGCASDLAETASLLKLKADDRRFIRCDACLAEYLLWPRSPVTEATP